MSITFNQIQTLLKDIIANPDKYIRTYEKGSYKYFETTISFEYILSGGRWDNFQCTENDIKDSENYLIAILNKIYNDNIEYDVNVEYSKGSTRKNGKIKLTSKTKTQTDHKFKTEIDLSKRRLKVEGGTFMQHTVTLILIIIGITGGIAEVAYFVRNEFESQRIHEKELIQMEFEDRKLQREHEKDLEVMRTLGRDYILDQIEKGNITLEYKDKLKKTMDSSFIPEKLQQGEDIKLVSLEVSESAKPNLQDSKESSSPNKNDRLEFNPNMNITEQLLNIKKNKPNM